MEDADRNRLRVATTITSRVSESVRGAAGLRRGPRAPGGLCGWQPRRRGLVEPPDPAVAARSRLVDVSRLSYSHAVSVAAQQLVYGEHGNQFHPANSIVDYANPLDTPGGRVTAVSCRLGMGTSRPAARHLGGLVLPVSPEPGPPLNALRDGSGALWCRHGRVSGGVKGARLAALGGLLDLLAQLGGTLLGPTRRPLPIALHGPDAAA